MASLGGGVLAGYAAALPMAFLQLKTLGWCEFELPECMFDADYPGHYLRRIKNVSVTIPCIVGPYAGVHCRLQLLSSGIRLSPALPTPPKCCCKPGPACIGPRAKDACGDAKTADWGGSCGPSKKEKWCTSAYTSPSSITRYFLASEAIATSTGQNDAGTFELSFRDDKTRAPFEFAGAVASRWRVEMPPRNNAFHLDSLTDFVLHVNYTAKEGGAALRDVAERAAVKRLPGDGLRFFDVRNEWAGAWAAAFGRQSHLVQGGGKRGKHGAKHDHPPCARTLALSFSRRAFPFLPSTHPHKKRNILITALTFFIDTAPSCDRGEHFRLTFKPAGGCKDDWKYVECTASCGTPGFFQGELRGVVLGPVCGSDGGGEGSREVGVLELPGDVGEGVKAVWMLVRWEAFEG